MQLATALRSMVEANPNVWPIEVWVLHDEFARSLRKQVLDSLPRGSASIHWTAVDLTAFQGFSPYSGISKIFYSRLLIPHIFEAGVSRVLYLDSDLLVLHDLLPLWETDLDGAVMGAVLDSLDAKLKMGEAGCEDLPRVRDYFNSGVLLIDLDRWREERIADRALKYLGEHPRCRFPDQDALNTVCDGRWKQLDTRWNYQDHYQTDVLKLPLGERPAIVHFVTNRKPWDARTLSLNAELYDSFRSRTLFARSWPEMALDMGIRVWCRLKRYLRQYEAIGMIRNKLGRRQKPRYAFQPATHLANASGLSSGQSSTTQKKSVVQRDAV